MKNAKVFLSFLLCLALIFSFAILVVAEEADVLGDVDGDGAITSTDARFVLLIVALKYQPFPGTKEDEFFTRIKKFGDVDGDDVITTTDARLILQCFVGKIEEFPVNEV